MGLRRQEVYQLNHQFHELRQVTARNAQCRHLMLITEISSAIIPVRFPTSQSLKVDNKYFPRVSKKRGLGQAA
jgi:hypothetical protein